MKIAYNVCIATQGNTIEWGDGLSFNLLVVSSDLPDATLKSELLCAEIREILNCYEFPEHVANSLSVISIQRHREFIWESKDDILQYVENRKKEMERFKKKFGD